MSYIYEIHLEPMGTMYIVSNLMKEDMDFEWDNQCQNALGDIRSYLIKPSILPSPVKCQTLILYISALDQSLGALLLQKEHQKWRKCLILVESTLSRPRRKVFTNWNVCSYKIYNNLQHYSTKLISKVDLLKYPPESIDSIWLTEKIDSNTPTLWYRVRTLNKP